MTKQNSPSDKFRLIGALLVFGSSLITFHSSLAITTNVIAITVTFTNAAGTTNGQTFAISNSANPNYTYTWTNAGTPAFKRLATTNSPAKAATNLYARLTNDWTSQSLRFSFGSPTSVVIRTLGYADLSAAAAGPPAYAIVSLATNGSPTNSTLIVSNLLTKAVTFWDGTTQTTAGGGGSGTTYTFINTNVSLGLRLYTNGSTVFVNTNQDIGLSNLPDETVTNLQKIVQFGDGSPTSTFIFNGELADINSFNQAMTGWAYSGDGTGLTNIGTNSMSAAAYAAFIGGSVDTNTIYTVASNTAAAMDSTKLATNTLGATVNAITYGLVPDGVTDNTVALSNLLNSASSIYFPGGTYAHSNPVIINHPVNIRGDSATLRYTGSSNFYALTFALSNAPGCTIDGMTFSPTQAAVSASGGMISLNCMGFAKVQNCTFLNTAGIAVFVSGDTNLQTRLNHYYISDNVFSNVYDGIVLDGSNKAEYGVVSGNRAHIVGRFGIKCASASVNIENNNLNGYTAPSPPLGAGIWLVPDNNRGHATVVGNTSHHFTFGIVVDQVTGSAGVVGNSFMGCVSNFIGGSSLITVVGNKFETTGTGNANAFTGLSSSVIVGNMFAGGNITGLTNAANGYNWDFTSGNAMLPLTGDASGLTNLSLATATGTLPQGSLPVAVVTNFGNANLASYLIVSNGANWQAFTNNRIYVYNLGADQTGTIFYDGDWNFSDTVNGSGGGLTALNASQLTSGTLAVPRFANTNNITDATTFRLVVYLGTNAIITNVIPNSALTGTTGTNTTLVWNYGSGAVTLKGTNSTSATLFAEDGKRLISYSSSPDSSFLLGAGKTNSTGARNLGIGRTALTALTTGTDNFAISQNGGLTSLTTGIGNVMLGGATGTYLTDGSYNTGIGNGALNGVNGKSMIQCVAVGNLSLNALTNGDYNTAVGGGAAAKLIIGRYNTFIGGDALRDATNTDENCGFGVDSLMSLKGPKAIASYNAAYGTYSLQFMSNGLLNAAFGYNAGVGLLTGNSNLFLGTQTTFTNGSGNIIIGVDCNALGATQTNALNIGNFLFGVGLTNGSVVSAGMLGVGKTNPATALDVAGAVSADMGFISAATNTLNFTTVGFFTNTLGKNAFAYFSAGTSVVVTNEYNNPVVSITTPTVVHLHPNWKVSGTTMSATLVAE